MNLIKIFHTRLVSMENIDFKVFNKGIEGKIEASF